MELDTLNYHIMWAWQIDAGPGIEVFALTVAFYQSLRGLPLDPLQL